MAGDKGLDWGFWRGDEKAEVWGAHCCKQIAFNSVEGLILKWAT